MVSLDFKITDSDSRPTLIFVHGIASNINGFKPSIDHFKKDYRILSLSLRGHGRSGKPDPECLEAYTVHEMAEDVMRLIRELGIDSFHYVGHSMGGIIGYDLFAKHPEYFRSITACASPAEINIPSWIASAGTSPLTAIPEEMLRGIIKSVIPYLSGRTKFSQFFLRSEIMPYVNPEAVRYCLMNLSNISYIDVLESIDKPLLVVHGRYDMYNGGLKPALEILKGRENFHYRYFEKAGHNVNLDFPKEFNNTLENFLKEVI